MPTRLPTRLSRLLHGPGRAGVRVIASGALAVGLLATAPDPGAHGATATQRHQARVVARHIGDAVHIAVRQKGDPYRYGADGPNAFDCSGLTYFSYRRAGFRHMPRTSSAQAHFARHIKRSHLRRGDLVFFYDRGGVYHVGVYAGAWSGRRHVLHAPYSGARVRTEPIWTDHWFAGTLRRR